MGQDLHLDVLAGAGQELGGLRQGTELHAGAVHRQDVVPRVQSPAPVESATSLPVMANDSAHLLGDLVTCTHPSRGVYNLYIQKISVPQQALSYLSY